MMANQIIILFPILYFEVLCRYTEGDIKYSVTLGQIPVEAESEDEPLEARWSGNEVLYPQTGQLGSAEIRRRVKAIKRKKKKSLYEPIIPEWPHDLPVGVSKESILTGEIGDLKSKVLTDSPGPAFRELQEIEKRKLRTTDTPEEAAEREVIGSDSMKEVKAGISEAAKPRRRSSQVNPHKVGDLDEPVPAVISETDSKGLDLDFNDYDRTSMQTDSAFTSRQENGIWPVIAESGKRAMMNTRVQANGFGSGSGSQTSSSMGYGGMEMAGYSSNGSCQSDSYDSTKPYEPCAYKAQYKDMNTADS